MARKKTKRELTWIGKENRPKLEPRVLIEDPAKSYHAKRRVGENDIFDNRLIFGGNLLEANAEARHSLHAELDAGDRLNKVARLIGGFGTPYGLLPVASGTASAHGSCGSAWGRSSKVAEKRSRL